MFCGLSQGVFIPTAVTYASNVVKPSSVAMASAVFTCAMCLGQLVSPLLLNNIAKMVFGEVTTSGVYTIAAMGMAISGVAATIWKNRTE